MVILRSSQLILRALLAIARIMSCLLFAWMAFGIAWFADSYFSADKGSCATTLLASLVSLSIAALIPSESMSRRTLYFLASMSAAGALGVVGVVCQGDQKITEEMTIAAGLWAVLWLRPVRSRP